MAKKKTSTAKSGGSVPSTENERTELYLAKAAGEDVQIPANQNTRLERYLKAIIDKISSFVGLPDVTSSDNGKILKVTDGAWAKGDAELPNVTESDENRILTVGTSGTWSKSPLRINLNESGAYSVLMTGADSALGFAPSNMVRRVSSGTALGTVIASLFQTFVQDAVVSGGFTVVSRSSTLDSVISDATEMFNELSLCAGNYIPVEVSVPAYSDFTPTSFNGQALLGHLGGEVNGVWFMADLYINCDIDSVTDEITEVHYSAVGFAKVVSNS